MQSDGLSPGNLAFFLASNIVQWGVRASWKCSPCRAFVAVFHPPHRGQWQCCDPGGSSSPVRIRFRICFLDRGRWWKTPWPCSDPRQFPATLCSHRRDMRIERLVWLKIPAFYLVKLHKWHLLKCVVFAEVTLFAANQLFSQLPFCIFI